MMYYIINGKKDGQAGMERKYRQPARLPVHAARLAQVSRNPFLALECVPLLRH